jgi:uncharacterized membrane protein YbhN (UPF0104 family)
MPNVRGAIARAIHKKFGWSSVAVTVSLLIVATAAFTLFHVFRQIELGRVIGALKAQSFRQLSLSGGFVVASYLALTCYDVFALRAIGRGEIPYRVAAFAGFTSYTIGHNLGAAVFTSGFVRYRIYSAWGLSVREIARIAFITGLTYWLANGFVLGGGALVTPEAASAIDHVPASINRLAGIAALSAIGGYLVWLWRSPRAIGSSDWQITLPNPPSTLVQIGIGSLDLVFVALAMYVLLPDQPAVDLGFDRYLCRRNAHGRRQPHAGQSRRHGGGHVHWPAADRQGGFVGLARDLPRPVFPPPTAFSDAAAWPARVSQRCRGNCPDAIGWIGWEPALFIRPAPPIGGEPRRPLVYV